MKWYCTNCGNVEAQMQETCKECGVKMVYTLKNSENQSEDKIVHVYTSGGVVNDVTNLPEGYTWELHDADDEESL